MRRYLRVLATIAAGSASIPVHQVIETDEVPHAEVLAQGFREIDMSEPREVVMK